MKWYKRDPDAFKGGTVGLSLEEVGAYTLLLDDIYARDGAVPDDELYCCRLLRCDPRVWRRLRARLIEAGKIQTTGVLLSNFRATSEVSSAKVRLMLARRLNEKRWKNNGSGTPHRYPPTEDTTTTTATEERKKEDTAIAVLLPAKFAFECGRIRLTQKDFDQWKKAYPRLNLEAELLQLSQYAEEQGSKWFFAVSGALTKRDRELGILEREKHSGHAREYRDGRI